MKAVFKVLILLIATVHVYNCENPSEQTNSPPDLSEEKQTIDSEKQKKSEEVDFKTSPLNKIDEELQHELKNPIPPPLAFEVKLTVLKNVGKYQQILKDLYIGVQNNTWIGLQLARKLVKQDGPKFLKEEIDEDKLKKAYNWDDENIQLLSDAVKNIKAVYHNITVNLKEKPSPIEIFFSKKKAFLALSI